MRVARLQSSSSWRVPFTITREAIDNVDRGSKSSDQTL